MTDKPYIKENFPLLAQIDSPADLKKLTVDQLPQVCDELRRFMVHELSTNPGHFASSMGAVEIVVALHYVFNTPDDRIVWDVGHQAYAHKILTGRRDRFDLNRKQGGLSGFPNPAESEYDTFIAGHASNSISAALGMSIAAELEQNPGRKVVAVIGDASIGGGLAFEGINNAANNPNNLLIILNDNDMSIDRPTGALGRYMTDMTTSKRYNNFRYRTYNFLRRHGVIGDSGKGVVMRFNNAMKSMLTGQQNIFEGLNIRYFGPFDGHDVKRLVKVFSEVKDMTGPKLVHLHTVKGKGYAPAEADPTTWHAPGKFDEVTGERAKARAEYDPPKYQDVFGKTLVELARNNDHIVGITAAMPGGTSMSMMLKEYPRRTFDVGISEGHAVTFAGGLAKDGMHPFVAIYSSFLQRAYDHIIHDVAIAGLPVTFCIDRGGLVGEDGVTHHGLFDLAYLRCIPGMVVSAPINEHDLRNLMFTAQNHQGPMAIRYPRGRGVLVDWRNDMRPLPIGKGRRLSQGNSHVAVLSIGHIGNNVAAAVKRLADEGMAVAHYDMIFLKPIDEDILGEVAQSCSHIVTVEDGTIVGGLGTAVAEWLSEHDKHCALTRLGVRDEFVDQGTVGQQHSHCGIDEQGIYDCLKQLITRNP
ncbi:MAG: 1-deoxy-D-xylulose-5-phosphate synthase [Muribaculaceae bacterium]|nr:1-deoxy-D-xylulose-5-phosphate synthase [Muribaculaceae bacterium]MBR1475945.1 1-deoxy-D-xylulose-5-phosphate synthase [Muribaculaceae bacterium]MBR1725577.1 1-deoxy-D-xylulose-5-phosphate synthase [Muribaculaceae bacterium]